MTLTYVGYSTDEAIRFRSSSGGITTAVIKYLFGSGYINTVLTCAFDEKKCRYVPTFVYSYDDYEMIGSVYQDMDLIGYVKNQIFLIKGRILIVCAPCQVKAIRNILVKNDIESVIISYFCSGQMSIDGTYKYYEFLGLDKTQIKFIRYRGEGWPNGITIKTKKGEIIKRPNYTEPWITLHRSHLYRPRRCSYCHIVESEDADLCVGDPWLKEYIEHETIGSNLFIVHSDFAKELVEQLKIKKAIKVKEVGYDWFMKSQGPNIEAKQQVRSMRKVIDKELSFISRPRYFVWASSSLSNMRKHIKLMHYINLYYKAKNQSFLNNIKLLSNKILHKLRANGGGRGWKRKVAQIGTGCVKGKQVLIQNPQCMFLGNDISIGNYTYFLPCTNYAGRNYSPKIVIGDGTWIGVRNSFAAINGITIGRNVLFAGYVHVTDHSHGYEDVNTPVSLQPLISKGPVIIEDECWLGFGSEILSGVHIGKHSIVAARAVVTKNVPPYSIVAGNPARIVKQYNAEKKIWEKVKK